MRRRDLLTMTALVPCVPLIRGVRAASPASIGGAPRRRARATDKEWPGEESWKRLNEAVGGNLIPVNFPLSVLKTAPDSAAAKAIDRCVQQLRSVAGPSGSYVNETNYFEKEWQRTFWGDNYSRLAQIKQKYDPEGLFFVHNGVGSEEWSADGFMKL